MDTAKDRADRAHRRFARGRSEATPVRALLSVMAVVALPVGVLTAVGLVLWFTLR